MAEKVTYLTKKGKEELEAHLAYLKGEKTNEIIKRIDTARGFGDLSENSEYDEARQEQRDNVAEIDRIEETLKNAVVVETADKLDKISIGLVATLKCCWNGNVADYHIVGSNEADPVNRMISNESPLGSALIGKKVGDKATIVVPAGERTYEVLEIKFAE